MPLQRPGCNIKVFGHHKSSWPTGCGAHCQNNRQPVPILDGSGHSAHRFHSHTIRTAHTLFQCPINTNSKAPHQLLLPSNFHHQTLQLKKYPSHCHSHFNPFIGPKSFSSQTPLPLPSILRLLAANMQLQHSNKASPHWHYHKNNGLPIVITPSPLINPATLQCVNALWTLQIATIH